MTDDRRRVTIKLPLDYHDKLEAHRASLGLRTWGEWAQVILDLPPEVLTRCVRQHTPPQGPDSKPTT